MRRIGYAGLGAATLALLLHSWSSAQSPPRSAPSRQSGVEATQSPSSARAATATPAAGRPSPNTIARPRDGVQHPDLDAAWQKHNDAVAQVSERIRAAITKQFDASTAAGDLDEAAKWQTISENFATDGDLPIDPATKSVVSFSATDLRGAREDLTEAYESLVKRLTMERKLPEAKAVRSELVAVLKTLSPSPVNRASRGTGQRAPRKPWENGRNWICLSSTPEEFKSHWSQGDNRGSVYYDPKTKTISIDSPWELGCVKFKGRWKEFYFEIATSKTSFGNLDMLINSVTFKLGSAAEKFPQGVPALVTYDAGTRVATVSFAGQPISQATVLDEEFQSSFECVLRSGGGQNAKVQLRELRLLAE